MSLAALFYPKSIAVIGASSEDKAVGNDIAENLVKQGYAGQLYLINPKIKELHGRSTFANIEEVPGQVELLILVIPATAVAAEIRKAASKKPRAAIVISAGFKEVGNQTLEEELAITCQELGITLVGPNCLGMINPEIKLNASFAKLMPPLGEVAFISQSGALCTAILDYAIDLNIGFSKFLSIGNKALLAELELIEYLHADPKTKVICLYAESLENAPQMIEKLLQLNLGLNPKPIIILKSGKTEAGMSAVASHTGSLSSSDSAYEALFAQAGMIRAATINELFDFVQVFTSNSLQLIKRVAILTNAGGPGVLTTDSLIENGLALAKLSAVTKAKLQEFLPKAASLKNPIDLLGDASASAYEQALQILASDEQVDALLVLLTPQSMTEPEKTAKAVIKLRQQTSKPIVVSLMGKTLVAEGVKILQEGGIAALAFPEAAAKSLAALAKFADWRQTAKSEVLAYSDVDREKVTRIFATAKARGQNKFPEAEALEITRAYNLPVLHSVAARDAAQLATAAKTFARPVAIKVISKDILHKSDVGGVKLGVLPSEILVQSRSMLEQVKKLQPKAKLEGILLMEMVVGAQELILGVNRSPLGTLIMVGLGGIYVEVFKDVSFGFAPLTKADALRMIRNLRSYQLLTGVRGQQTVDIETIVEAMGRLSQLSQDFSEIIELDINPLLVTHDEARVADARLVIK